MEPCYRHFAVKALIFQSFSYPQGVSERRSRPSRIQGWL